MIAGEVVLVTGVTGRVGAPIAKALARQNRVYGVARFSDDHAAGALSSAGIRCIRASIEGDDLGWIPEDVTCVFHAAAALPAATEPDIHYAMEVNAQASGRLMARLRRVKAFVFCSSGSVYKPQGARALSEDGPLGIHRGNDNYSLSKISAESVVEFCAREWGIPTVTLRIFTAYGSGGGMPAARLDLLMQDKPIPLNPRRPNLSTPIFEDDYVALGARALTLGGVPPLVVNLAGSEVVSAEEYCAYLGQLVGRHPQFHYTAAMHPGIWADTRRMHAVLGRAEVPWREGMRRVVQARYPQALMDAGSDHR